MAQALSRYMISIVSFSFHVESMPTSTRMSTYHGVDVRQDLVWCDPAVLLKNVSHALINFKVFFVPASHFAGVDVLLCGGHRGFPAEPRIRSIE